jgi:hypothetical protein
MFERIATLWCKRAHTRSMWPIHGRYICAQCLRQHPVAWDGPKVTGAQNHRLILMPQPEIHRGNCISFPGEANRFRQQFHQVPE